MEELLKKLGIAFSKYIANTEYGKSANRETKKDSYNKFAYLMDNISKDRSIKCRPFEGIQECPVATVTSQAHDSNRYGTSTSRIYTVIGTDGVVIEVLGYDILQKIRIFVRHPDGATSYEEYDPAMAIPLMERTAAAMRREERTAATMEEFIRG